ncbi:hypothetical protein EPUS_00935 [Endocarpon pusillum Z07020]|uniref:Uncharacterized protein n=1 Tax=Endocarpon pusillum (strain Z07020 / HMAS-L-300199) TaxID=1263415 RepID=U1G8C7_ENDPU|nr:uncharacterized protein EPUS_00935 [Endocarpon pusillum Z07020]ERF73682.1 hypothetical protein EPUS_00935 [Endocarpon pusillum Z07020]
MAHPQDSSSSSVPVQGRRSGQSQTHQREAWTMQNSDDNGSPSREPSSDASSFCQNSRTSESSLVNAPDSPTQDESDDSVISPLQKSFGNDSLQGIGGDLYPPGEEHLLGLSHSNDSSAQDQSADSGENNAAQADGTVKIGENESKK